MCKCGCNTCETKIRGPLLTESKVKSLLSENLQYHIDKQIPLFETVFRIGSNAHLKLIKEARKMYSRNVIDLCEEDEHLIKTHLGEFALYENESVPLDLPMLEIESELQGYLVADVVDDIIKILGPRLVKGEIKDGGNPNKIYLQLTDKKFANEVINLLKSELGIESQYDITFGNMPSISFWADKVINEAEFKGKEVPLGKPKRGGSKKYYVYVKNPKTGRVKKVSFGDTSGLSAKIRNKDARTAFAARHDCKNKKDRTKASYWSCNLPRYATALGLGANMSTYW
jgi:hypothetical protein